MDTGVRHKAVLWPRRGILAVLATGPLVGCGKLLRWEEDRSQLPILLEDPMAAKDLLGLTLKEGTESGYRRPLGKPRFTEVRRVFSLGDGDRQGIFDRAVAFAKESGWVSPFEGSRSRVSTWHGEKSEPRRDCYVHIPETEPDELIITLNVSESP
jgi:hypothetical protein